MVVMMRVVEMTMRVMLLVVVTVAVTVGAVFVKCT
jgi:hypothetical protein